MCIEYRCTQYHMPRYTAAFVIAIKQKAKTNIRTTAMLLFHILLENVF
jgi:hypothetical protein